MSVSTAATPQAIEAQPTDGAGGSRSSWLLIVCCAAQFMVILDLSIVNVALPSIQSALGFTAPELQWIVDAYSITFAGFLMFGGRAADHFGQRRMFVLALALFALASLAGGLAPDRGTLIAARAAQGLGGALMAACSLAIITSSFTPGPELHRAIGAWASMNGLGGAAGMLFGGIITQELSWRWVLLINPPIGIAAALVAYAVVSERRRGSASDPPRSFDLAGALTLTIGQIVLVFGIVEAGLAGLDTFAALGPIIGGLIVLAVFGVIEARFAREPLIPFKQLTKPLRIANNIVLLFSASLFPLWFVSSLYLQQVLYLSPFHTGLIFLPMTLVIMLVASRTGKLVSHFGVRPVLGGGLIMLTAGMLLLAKIGSSGSPIVYIMIPGLLVAAGIAMSIVPSTIAATQGAKEGQAGLASGLVNTSRQVGGGLGLAILVTLATSRSSHLIGAGHGVAQSLTDGFRLAYLIGGGLAAAAALVTFTALPKPSAALAPAVRRLAAVVGVVVAGFVGVDFALAGSHGAPVGAYTTRGAYSFVTAPTLHPPKLRQNGTIATGALAPGYIFTTNFYNLNYPPLVGQSGPLILDSRLQPVWFTPVPEKLVASDLSLQTYEGKPALAWWQGVVTATGATESGEDVVVNQHYQTVAKLRGKDGWKLTLHAIVISGVDAWVTANKNIAKNLSSYGGAYNGALIDSAVQEYNLKTGQLLRTWDALDHIPLGDSRATVPTNGFPWDAYHVNAVDLTGNGSVLVSMRNTWAAYMVNIDTGKIEWTLGGKHSSFKFGRGAEFQWQHDVALGVGGNTGPTVTVFDDHCCQLTGGGTSVPPTGPSRGLVLELSQSTHVATLEAQYGDREGFKSEYMGDTQPLANSNTFVGWGSAPYFTEYNAAGKLLLEAEFPGSDLSYRTMVERWVGLPLTAPAVAARESGGKTTVYASWNGATLLASWRVLAGSGAGHMAAVSTSAKSGFETAIAVPAPAASFQVQALDAAGHVIGTSRQISGSRPASSAVLTDTAARTAASNPVAVSPEPGTPDASPVTQISFLGSGPTTVSDVHVVGSHSGAHAGVLRAYSTGTGESFLPAHPFLAGERVTVTAQVTSGGATATARSNFTIAHQAPVSQKEFPNNPGNPQAIQHYSTAPTLTPSTVAITTQAKPGAAPGDLLMAPYQGEGTAGPMIVEQNGALVWFHPLAPGEEATSLRVQQLDGKPVLTWWQGRILEVGFGQGEDVIDDTAYQRIGVVHAGNGYHADLHEFHLTSEGTAWIDMFDPIDMDLSRYGGLSNGVITDSVIQEIDVKTGLVMWEWHALGHIPIGESHTAAPKAAYPWDYVHINSISPGGSGPDLAAGTAGADEPGNVLLSSRATWTLYDVDERSGGIRWRLGGEHSSFKLGSGTRTYWQHDAEWQPGGLISVFDNGSDPPEEKQSRGLLLDPNPSTHTVTLIKQLTNPTKTLLASSQGNTLSLPGGDWLMGYGGLPNFTEYDASGHVLLDGTLGKNVQDFRTYLYPWSGQAPGAPSVVAAPGAGGTIAVAVSWNGATEVASWQVLAGASPSALAPAATAAKSGFQTSISVPSAGPYVAVRALSGTGAVIGTSATVKD